MFFFTTQPLWLSAIALVGVPTLLAMSGTFFVRRHVGLERLSTNNEVAGFKFATIGVIYAVLLAFAVIIVWEKFSDAENAVAREAGAAATIYRLLPALGENSGPALRVQMDSYLKNVIGKDWPAMEEGQPSNVTTRALDALYAMLLTVFPSDARGQEVFAEVMHQLDLVTEARRARLVLASGSVPYVLWLVLFGGALLTVGFTFFFGTENLKAQTLMTGALALLVFSGLLVIVVIDHPFAGTIKVEPHALIAVLEDFGLEH
jgi:Na+/melibiose symporter-like transporter